MEQTGKALMERGCSGREFAAILGCRGLEQELSMGVCRSYRRDEDEEDLSGGCRWGR